VRQNLRAARQLFLVELHLFLREPFAVFFTLVFPMLIMLIFSSVFGDEPSGYGDFKVADLLLPSSVATILAYLGLMGIPIALSEYRDMGVLRRFKATPLGLSSLMAAHLAVQFLFFILASVLVVSTSALLFGTRFRGNLPAFLGVAFLSAVAMFSFGFLLVGVTKGTRTAQAVGAGIFFPMLFVSGATIPRSDFPTWLFEVSEYIPLTRVVDNLSSTWIDVPFVRTNWVTVVYLLVLIVALFLASEKLFRWD